MMESTKTQNGNNVLNSITNHYSYETILDQILCPQAFDTNLDMVLIDNGSTSNITTMLKHIIGELCKCSTSIKIYGISGPTTLQGMCNVK